MTNYYAPTIEEMYVGFECEKQSQEAIGYEISKKFDLKVAFNINYEININHIFIPHVITEKDIQLYSLNPLLIKHHIRVKQEEL